MKIVRKTTDQNIILNKEDFFKNDLGWEENMENLERETLEKIINPIQNYETVRFSHEPYNNGTLNQSDIWFKFYFLDNKTPTFDCVLSGFANFYTTPEPTPTPTPTHHIEENGLIYVNDYEPTGLTAKENALMLKQTTDSFFRLEFYKTPNNESPERTNRRLVFSKNLSLPLGEKFYYTILNDYIFKPFFIGSNFRNKENMYLYWFQDDTALNEETLTGNTFYMTAKFFNTENGEIIDFVTSDLIGEVNESSDMYYKVTIDRENHTYQIFRFNGINGERIGKSGDPIIFYERKN